MGTQRIEIRHVRGRYPNDPNPLQSQNIEVSVVEEARVYRVRIDDCDNDEMWLEIVVEVLSDDRPS